MRFGASEVKNALNRSLPIGGPGPASFRIPKMRGRASKKPIAAF
jgi:hypothetical protein